MGAVDVGNVEIVGRLVLAVTCVALLIGARWYHERRTADVSTSGLSEALTEPSRGDRRSLRPLRPLAGSLSQSLYWLGLTTSAALAAQAIAAVLANVIR